MMSEEEIQDITRTHKNLLMGVDVPPKFEKFWNQLLKDHINENATED